LSQNDCSNNKRRANYIHQQDYINTILVC